jgi:anaerobic selenocysteine-containing dehydrogenase
MPNQPHEGTFPTDSGRAKFFSSQIEPIDLTEGELLLTTIRSHDQFNTTVYEVNDRYRGISGSRRVILMNEKDIAERGLKQGEVVDITSHFEGKERRAESFIVVPYPIPKDCAAAYYPEANALVPIDSVAEKSNCPTSKLIKVTVAPHLHNGERVFSGAF